MLCMMRHNPPVNIAGDNKGTEIPISNWINQPDRSVVYKIIQFNGQWLRGWLRLSEFDCKSRN